MSYRRIRSMEVRTRTKVGWTVAGVIVGFLGAATPVRAANIQGQVVNAGTGIGMAGVTANLFDTTGKPFGSVPTGPNGNYTFTGLASGNYLIQEVTPNGFIQTNPFFPNLAPTAQ